MSTIGFHQDPLPPPTLPPPPPTSDEMVGARLGAEKEGAENQLRPPPPYPSPPLQPVVCSTNCCCSELKWIVWTDFFKERVRQLLAKKLHSTLPGLLAY